MTSKKDRQFKFTGALLICVVAALCMLAVTLYGTVGCSSEQISTEGVDVENAEETTLSVSDKGSDNEQPEAAEGSSTEEKSSAEEPAAAGEEPATDAEQKDGEEAPAEQKDSEDSAATETSDQAATEEPVATAVSADAGELRGQLSLSEDYRSSFVHGDKGADYQKYIVLHDTEGDGSASSVVEYWDSSDAGVAAHFVINKDGSIVQCVPLDKITHHAGFGDTGHNALYGVEDESRDDKVGTSSIGSWAADYGMNSYSIGIEMVHVGGAGSYPEAQLEALDDLIAYIDAYYGFESSIIDHKAWRTGNSDTSAEFAEYLANYQATRTHDGS